MTAEIQFQPGERITHHEYGQGVVLDPARDGYLRAFFSRDGPSSPGMMPSEIIMSIWPECS